jgi:hypothetical protein
MPNFTNFATEHPNYFPGQYLLEDDFELQHKYFSDRQRYHYQTLHVSGIIEGLEVVIQDKKSVQIKSGSAINSNGELIVLKQDITFSEFNNIKNGELYIRYIEEKQVQQQKDVADSYTRLIENPKVEFGSKTPDDCVKLAKLVISEDNITSDINVREYSGLSLPNTNSTLTLRSGGNANPNLAILTGSLKIDGNLEVKDKINLNGNKQIIFTNIDTTNNLKLQLWQGYGLGINPGTLFYTADGKHSWRDSQNNERMLLTTGANGGLTVNGTISGRIDAGNITTGQLAAERIPSLSANKITSGTITGNLTINGNIELLDYGKQIQLIKTVTAEGVIAWGTIQANSYVGLQIGFPDGSFGGKLQIGSLSSTKEKLFNELMVVNADGNTSLNRNLTVKGAIQPSAGNSENNGIMFPKDPGGGSGDAAWIRYYSRNPSSADAGQKEQTTLEIGISNDPQDYISLNPGSNPINFTGNWNGTPDSTTNVAEISNDTTGHKTLMIIGNKSGGLGRRVSVWDRFEVNGTFVNNSSQEHKKDITKLSREDFNSIIDKLKQTPVFRYRFKAPGIDGKMRLGVIAEQSPEEILDESGKAVSFLDYNGFLLAALKAQQSIIEQLQNDILLLQKG